MIPAAILGSGVVGAIGSTAAASTQASGQEQAANTQLGMFNTINAQEQPFMQAGYGATSTLNQLLGTAPVQGGGTPGQPVRQGPSGQGTPGGATVPGTGLPGGYLTQQFAPTQAQLNAYPGYQFALNTGGQAVRNADTPGMGALSGSALKDLTSFNVGTANQYYGQYFNQFQTQQNNIFSRLSGIAGLGQNAASNVGTSGTSLGTGMAQAQAAAAGSTAGGIVGATSSLGSSAVPLAYLMAGQSAGTGAGSAAGEYGYGL
jgi:hypothetical protein